MSLAIRWPHLNRPLSKHHEFNPAVILLCLDSWQQQGGAAASGWVPVLNYGHAGDRFIPDSLHIDPRGHHTYTSFGPLWYWIPYVTAAVLRIDPDPLFLQVLNMMLGGIAWLLLLLVCLKLWENHEKRYPLSFTCHLLFQFNAGVLWYFGNGYVLNMLSVIPLLILFRLYLTGSKGRWWHIAWALTWFVWVWLDWLPVFFLVVLLVDRIAGGRRLPGIARVTAVAAVLCAMLLIGVLYVRELGWVTALNQLESRFLLRSIGVESAKPQRFLHFPKHFIACYAGWVAVLPALALLRARYPAMFPQQTLPARPFRQLVLGSVFALLAYNLLFLNWSVEHEFSVLAWSVPLAILLAWYLVPLRRGLYRLLMGFLLLSNVAMFYLLNPPGPFSFTGDRYDSYRETGLLVRQVQHPDYALFLNRPFDPMVMYYAGRTYSSAPDPARAADMMQYMQVNEGLFLHLDGTKVTRVDTVRKAK